MDIIATIIVFVLLMGFTALVAGGVMLFLLDGYQEVWEWVRNKFKKRS